jgi:type IV pilus assembly protein PilY1
VGADGTTAVNFVWDDLPLSSKRALARPLDQGNTAALTNDEIAMGQKRLNYLRGSEADTAAQGWRVRGGKLGDIINSSAVYVGAPTQRTLGTNYSTFYNTNKNRVRAVYVGANDGMLHAFQAGSINTSGNRVAGTGAELFAYIPSFIVPKLYKLAESSYMHESFVDATPTVGEALVGNNWKTVLVSGAGGGGQGVFALDVTNPNAFDASKVLWEFSDADDVDVGNVLGRPQLLKMRTSAPDAETPTYKWFAVFASGVNSYSNENGDTRFAYGGTNTNNNNSADNSGNPVLFILDLSKPAGTAWQLNINYYKIALPNSDSMAKGMIGFAAKGGRNGEVTQIYAGDLQGNLWKLDFTQVGTGGWNYNTGLVANNGQPIFTATVNVTSSSNTVTRRQPITMEPELAFGPNGSTIVLFGTGKFLEQSDLSSFTTQSVYALLDDGRNFISGKSALRQLSVNNGVISGDAFVWGFPSAANDTTTKPGWYFDFPNSATTGERQISGFALLSGQVFFGSIVPATTTCETGSGNVYTVSLPSGSGSVTRSIVGIQGEPSVIQVARSLASPTSAGLRTQTTRYRVVTKGSSGIGTATNPQVEKSEEVGRYSWREVVNYKALREE